MWVLSYVVLAVDWIRGSNDATTSVERSVNTGFGDGDSLLFHDLVDCDSIYVAHFVELVDTDNSSVSEDHGASLETTFSGFLVRCNRSRQTDTRRSTSGGGNG